MVPAVMAGVSPTGTVAAISQDAQQTVRHNTAVDGIRSSGARRASIALYRKRSVPIQLAQCWFTGLAISDGKKINIFSK